MDIIVEAIKSGDYKIVQETNRAAENLIEQYAKRHAGSDAGISLVGFLPIPGVAIASLAATLATQVSVIKSLAFEIGRLYRPSEDSVRTMTDDDLARQMGLEFLAAIKPDIVAEMRVAFVASALPIIGGLIGSIVDLSLGVTLKWRVGVMASIYYQNAGQWIDSREETYKISKEMVKDFSPETAKRVDLNRILEFNPKVLETQAALATTFVASLREVSSPSISDEKLREMLRVRGYPENLINASVIPVPSPVDKASSTGAHPRAKRPTTSRRGYRDRHGPKN